MLEDALKGQLKTLLERVTRPVELVASVDDGAKSKELLELLSDIESLSPQVSVRTDGDNARRPSFAITTPDQAIDLHFAGIPLGHEFTSLALALLQVGGYPPKISDEIASQIRSLPGEYNFETYFSLSCQNCPDVVQALNTMAVLNPNVHHVAIEGGAYQNEIDDRQVMAVPNVWLNGEAFEQGRMSLEEILAKIDTGAGARKTEEINAKDPYDVLIIGAGPSGSAAAIYAARKGLRTGLAAERCGGQVLETMSIENFISVAHTEGPALAAALEEHVRSYDVDVMEMLTATALVPASSVGGLHEVQFEGGAVLKSKTVILATGAKWLELKVPGDLEYRNKGVTFCPHCDGPLFKGKNVAVIGGGNSGIEAAIDLAGVVGHVTVIELDTQLRADAVLQDALKALPNVDIITGAKTTEIVGDGSKVTGLTYENVATGSSSTIDLSGVFVQIGLVPQTKWLGNVLELSPRGEIVVDEVGTTSVPGIFASGDVTTSKYKQIVIAVGTGATASLAAFDHLVRSSVPASV